MKPIHTFFFLLISILGLGVLIMLLPEGGFSIYNYKLELPVLEDLKPDFAQKDSLAKDKPLALIPEQIANLELNMQEKKKEKRPANSSLLDIEKKEIIFHIDTLKTRIQKIEFPDNDKSDLFAFFEQVKDPDDVVRVLHYGDSQIEGDRISAFLRNQLQKEFGGYGIGLLSPKPLVKSFGIKQVISENWLRYPVFGRKEGDMPHKKYGGLGVVCRYTPYGTTRSVVDSAFSGSGLLNDTSIIHTGEIHFSKSRLAYFKDRKMKNFRIFYANREQPVLAEIYHKDSLLYQKQLDTNTSMSLFEYRFRTMPKEFTVKFKGTDSPDFYAMSLDADKGVVVDNIPMRGSSGTYFTQMNKHTLKLFYQKLNIGLILLEFGGNVIPHLENLDGIKKYESWFSHQIELLKQLQPNTPIIVMGVADMSKKIKGEYKSYPLIEPLRDAMKRAAFRSGAAYWDMYEAMGGANSMPHWVNNKTRLAIKDYTHFTSKGAHLMGNIFLNALLYEYQAYKSKKNKKQISCL